MANSRFDTTQQQAYNHLNADTRQEQKNIESNYGIRYSVILELPYWNPIEHSVVDPMHNLFLGTGKHVMKVWVERGIITKRDFSKLEQVVAKTPRSVRASGSGRAARAIALPHFRLK